MSSRELLSGKARTVEDAGPYIRKGEDSKIIFYSIKVLEGVWGNFLKEVPLRVPSRPSRSSHCPVISFFISSSSSENILSACILRSTASMEDMMVEWLRLKILPMFGKDISVISRRR